MCLCVGGTSVFSKNIVLVYCYVLRTISNASGSLQCITKRSLYNFDLLKPHFYIVKLGFTGVYIIFLFSVQNH